MPPIAAAAGDEHSAATGVDQGMPLAAPSVDDHKMPSAGLHSAEAANADTAELNARLDRLEALIADIDGVVGANYQRSLAVLKERAEAAESRSTERLLRQLAIKLALTVDTMDRFVADWADRASSAEARSFLDFVDHVSEEVTDVLDDFGIEQIPAHVGDPVDRTAHRVVATPRGPRPSDEQQLVIAHRARRGYSLDGYVIRAADVFARYR